MAVVRLRGWRKLWVELVLGWRLLWAGRRRFGLLGFAREIWRYLADNRNLFVGAGAHYVALLDEAGGREVYAATALPPIDSPAFVDYVLEEVATFNRRQPAPLVFTLLSVSSRCPCRCRYCYAAAELGETEKIPLPRLEAAVRDLAARRVPSVFLTGGEPLMRKDELPALLESCSDTGVAFWLVTSGWGVDVDILRRLMPFNLKGVVVSLDASVEREANRSKGQPDAWRNALGAIEAALQVGLVVSVDCMVPAGSPLLTEEGYQSFLDFLQGLGVHFLNLFPPHPSGAAAQHHLPGLSAQEILQLESLMKASNRRRGQQPLAYAAVVWEFRRGCVGGQQFIYVDPAGNVRACPFLRASAGSILEEPLEQILQRLRAQGEQPGCFTAFAGLSAERRT